MDNQPLTYKDYYPTDIFPELKPFELECVNNLCKKILGFPLDRLSAHIGRELIKHRLEEERSAVKLLKAEIKKLIPDDITDTYGQGLTDALRLIDAIIQIGDTDDNDNSKANL